MEDWLGPAQRVQLPHPYGYVCVSLSPLHSKCSTLRDLNIVRPNRTELRMAQDAQLPPPLDDLSLAKVARAAHPAARARVCPYIRDDDCEYDYYSSYAILFVGLRNKSEL